MHQVNTEIWTLSVVARTTLTKMFKEKMAITCIKCRIELSNWLLLLEGIVESVNAVHLVVTELWCTCMQNINQCVTRTQIVELKNKSQIWLDTWQPKYVYLWTQIFSNWLVVFTTLSTRFSVISRRFRGGNVTVLLVNLSGHQSVSLNTEEGSHNYHFS